MNARDLMNVIGEAQDAYVLDAMKTREGVTQKPHLSLKRTLLIAAMIVLSLLLVGCAVVYALRLQELKIADAAVTQRFNEDGRAIEPTEVHRDVISLNSYSGSPLQLATKEWYEFTQAYDPDGSLRLAADVSGISEDLVFIYDCYTPEKLQKLEEIIQKYDLTLLTRQTLVQRYQNGIFFDALGIPPLCKADASTEITYGSGYFYENGNFQITVDLQLPELWQEQIWSTVFYSHKDCFDPAYSTIDIEAFTQWDYTTADGTALLLAQQGSHAYIFADKGDAMLTVALNLDPLNVSPFGEKTVPARAVVEQTAELFDYTVSPVPIADFAPIDQALQEAEQAWLESHLSEEAEFTSFGDYLLSQFWIDDLYYVNLDLEGDGQQELLLADKDEVIQEILWMRDGKVAVRELDFTRLCEGNVLVSFDLSEEYDLEAYSYYRMPYGEQEFLDSIEHREDTYCRYGYDKPEEEITAEEFAAIRSQYPYAQVDWRSALDYVTDSGETVGKILDTQAIVLSQEGQQEILARAAAKGRSVYQRKFYTFLDMNGDGQEELLLGADEDSFNSIYLMRRNRAQCVYEGTSQLCQGNVFSLVGEFHDYDRGWVQQYTYQRLVGSDLIPLDTLYYWQGTDTWTTSRTGDPISPEDTAAIQANYPPADLGMRPLSELMDRFGIE